MSGGSLIQWHNVFRFIQKKRLFHPFFKQFLWIFDKKYCLMVQFANADKYQYLCECKESHVREHQPCYILLYPYLSILLFPHPQYKHGNCLVFITIRIHIFYTDNFCHFTLGCVKVNGKKFHYYFLESTGLTFL